jgi:hypothetical protein
MGIKYFYLNTRLSLIDGADFLRSQCSGYSIHSTHLSLTLIASCVQELGCTVCVCVYIYITQVFRSFDKNKGRNLRRVCFMHSILHESVVS